mmetsp:Transcript_3989/g.13309  ORF Transcript_3989/g.13309 Transcript_3989/m.13309 type:complete len:240 (-) Transcript_3989:603-1322(-)
MPPWRITRAIANDTATAAAVATASSVVPNALNRLTAKTDSSAVAQSITITPKPPTFHRLRSRAASKGVFRVNTKSDPREPFPRRTFSSKYVVASTTDEGGPIFSAGIPPIVIVGESKYALIVAPSSAYFAFSFARYTANLASRNSFLLIAVRFVSSPSFSAASFASLTTSSSTRTGSNVPFNTTSPGIKPNTRNATRFTTTLGSYRFCSKPVVLKRKVPNAPRNRPPAGLPICCPPVLT